MSVIASVAEILQKNTDLALAAGLKEFLTGFCEI